MHKIISKKVFIGLLLYFFIGTGLGVFITNDLAREDVAIGKICQTYEECFVENSLVIILLALAWPLGVFTSLLNLDGSGLFFLAGVITLLLYVRYFPGKKLHQVINTQ